MKKASDIRRARLTLSQQAELRRRIRKSREKLTPEEDAAITAAALADPDAQPVDALFRRKMGRPRAEKPKQQIALRLDPEVIERFKADGPGWQTRMNKVLRKAVGL